MTGFETVVAHLGPADAWKSEHGSRWLSVHDLDVRRMATVLATVQARFITMTAQARALQPDVTLTYHWDLDGEVLSFVTHLPDKRATSIFDLCPAADWIEREIHEGYDVEFVNRPHEPLLLRHGAAAGVNLREADE